MHKKNDFFPSASIEHKERFPSLSYNNIDIKIYLLYSMTNNNENFWIKIIKVDLTLIKIGLIMNFCKFERL